MAAPTLERHPLVTLLARNHWTAEAYLRRVAAEHQALGYGAMATRKEKISRWTREGIVPERSAQEAIARLHRIDPAEIDRRGWPYFLLLAIDDDRNLLESPWTPAGTVKVLTEGAPVDADRRAFMIFSIGAVAAATAQWATASPSLLTDDPAGRVGSSAADLFDARLEALGRLDDTVGAGRVYDAAVMEQRLITGVIARTSHSPATNARLFACASRASRLAGWCAYDRGQVAVAERHFLTALRSAASADNPTLGAIAMSFWANLRYAHGDPAGARQLADGALAEHAKIPSGRVKAILHTRAARAHSKAGESAAAFRRMDAAFAAYDRARPVENGVDAMYWVNLGELHASAASAALSLGEPQRALEHFSAAFTEQDPYDLNREPRGAVIYLARQSEAHLALGDLDAAVDVAKQVAVIAADDADSERSASAFADMCSGLRPYGHVRAVADFLEA